MKKTLGKVLVLVLSLAMLFSVPIAADAADEPLEFTFTCAQAAAAGTPGANLFDNFVRLVDEKSNGTIKCNFLAAGSVVSTEREATEAIQVGTVDVVQVSDMGIDSVIGGCLGWAWLPYTVTSYEQVDELYNGGWMHDEIVRMMEENGIIKIANTENGFRQVGNVKHEILDPDDFSGLKIRTPEIKELLRFYELNGALSVAIAASETLTAISQGTIDGVDNTLLNLQAQGLLDALPYITITNHIYSGGSIIANPDFWNGLTDEQRTIIEEAAVEAGNIHIQESRELEAALMTPEGIEEAGYSYQIAQVTPELDAALREYAMQVWEEFGDQYDPDCMQKIMDEFGTK